MNVFVLDTNKKPQNPVHSAKARLLLSEKKAAVFQMDKALLTVKATGHGGRHMRRVNRFGFLRTKAKSTDKKVKGFQTGDIAKAIVTIGKKVGTYIGRVAVRKSGSFNIKTVEKTIQGISWRYCRMFHSSDGYSYNTLC